MKKLYALLVCMFLFAVTCVAVQSVNSHWEKLDGDVVCGGCVKYTDTEQCGGGSTKCNDVECGVQGGGDGTGTYICPPFGYNFLVPHRNLEVQQQEFYYSSTGTGEAGRVSSESVTVLCTKKVECAATSCTISQYDGGYYCSQASEKNGTTETGWQLTGNICP